MGHVHTKEHIEKSGIVWPLRLTDYIEYLWSLLNPILKLWLRYFLSTVLSIWPHMIVILLKQDIRLISKKSLGRSERESLIVFGVSENLTRNRTDHRSDLFFDSFLLFFFSGDLPKKYCTLLGTMLFTFLGTMLGFNSGYVTCYVAWYGPRVGCLLLSRHTLLNFLPLSSLLPSFCSIRYLDPEKVQDLKN